MTAADFVLRVHRLQRARLAVTEAEDVLRHDGVDLALLDQALALHTADPAAMAAEAEALGFALDASGAPIRMELVQVFERTVDETLEESRSFARAAGRAAAILCSPETAAAFLIDLRIWRIGSPGSTTSLRKPRRRARAREGRGVGLHMRHRPSRLCVPLNPPRRQSPNVSTSEGADPMTPPGAVVLTGDEVADLGEALYGLAWAKPMARDLGISSRSCHGYRQNGASGAQAAALIGLLARRLHEKADAEFTRRKEHEDEVAHWFSYLRDYEGRLRRSGPAHVA